jgi:hypothetical protein
MKTLSLLSLLLLTSCSTVANYLEDQLECDEEVNVELKCKIDFEDNDEKSE